MMIFYKLHKCFRRYTALFNDIRLILDVTACFIKFLKKVLSLMARFLMMFEEFHLIQIFRIFIACMLANSYFWYMKWGIWNLIDFCCFENCFLIYQ